MTTNAEASARQNDLRRLCQLYVMEHEPELYYKFQKVLDIKPRYIDPRLRDLMEKAMRNGSTQE